MGDQDEGNGAGGNEGLWGEEVGQKNNGLRRPMGARWYETAPGPAVSGTQLNAWLKEAGKDQCLWAAEYLWNRIPANPVAKPDFLAWDRESLSGFIIWLLCGEGENFRDMVEVPEWCLKQLRVASLMFFKKTRNAWNQKALRLKQKEEAANYVYLGGDAKQELEKIAKAHGLSKSECVEELVLLVAERRTSIKDLASKRKEAKRAALAVDLGFEAK